MPETLGGMDAEAGFLGTAKRFHHMVFTEWGGEYNL
jgi:hypothetical protein